jgi:glucosamine--fructose-6-phosphate aminotransferase (isomerizing)
MTYLARGINYAIALEGSLKLKEISYIHSQAYPCGELKHGPIALIDNKMPCFIIANKNKEYEKILNTINEIKSRKGEIICITTINNKDLEKYTKDIIYVPKIDYDFEPFLNVVVTQLFAYYIADLKNKKIDKPRNLAKSVTVE